MKPNSAAGRKRRENEGLLVEDLVHCWTVRYIYYPVNPQTVWEGGEMTDDQQKEWDERLSNFVNPQPDRLSLYALCLAKDLECKKMRRSLEAANFTDEGGEYWKPPIDHKYRELWKEKERLREKLESYENADIEGPDR